MMVTILPGHGIKIQCGGENAAFHFTHCRSGGRVLLLIKSQELGGGIVNLLTLLHYNTTVTLEHSGTGLLLCGAVTKTGIEMFSFYGNLAASLALVTL